MEKRTQLLSPSKCLKALLGAAFLPALALACASCGSGGEDPLILYPNESHKFYLGQSNTFGIKNVELDGSLVTAGGPILKSSATVAYGERLGRDLFATVTVPVIRNQNETRSETALADPSLSLRYTILLPTLVDPRWVPQVQLIMGYKFAVSRGVFDSEDPKELMDVFGTGFSELRFGVDVWSGNGPVKMGFAFTAAQPLARTIKGAHFEPGIVLRSTVTGGYDWATHLRLSAGIVREDKAGMILDGVPLPVNESLSHTVFLNQDWDVTEIDRLRLSYVQTSALFENRGGVNSHILALAYMRVL
ncbi:MAG: hypothetical protein HYZ71_14500 [Deltaproteobacteria bacterium]|nr:hypothetical protein [Deltaproteobacteria bacterium]